VARLLCAGSSAASGGTRGLAYRHETVIVRTPQANEEVVLMLVASGPSLDRLLVSLDQFVLAPLFGEFCVVVIPEILLYLRKSAAEHWWLLVGEERGDGREEVFESKWHVALNALSDYRCTAPRCLRLST
jgi:hypothetical protein